MSREPEARVAELLYQALALPPARRTAFLDEACADDAELREEVLDLLRHQADDSFLEPLEPLTDDRPPAPLPGRIGPFRPLAVLGFGGMGVVYEAQQEHPPRRVALKVLRITNASGPAIQRFLQEGQALARLHHPGIVPILEAGSASLPEGQVPYFAMELVEGQRLDRFVQGGQLSTPQRLELFLRICDAVQHAHDRGVIHRDLKPANVLVDAGGQPRILDFGVARLIDADVPTTLRTAAGILIGTLGYMSPEQAAGAPQPVDLRCDVYALGVMLYELLCGRPPLALADKPLPEALRMVREAPPLPLRSVSRRLHADLEVIAHKCIEKDPRRRYATVAELAADVRRHLAGESIVARPPAALTRIGTFVRRNQRAVVSAALVVAALSIGLGAALDQRNQARFERDQAQRMLALLERMLILPDPELGERHDVTVRELLDRFASDVLIRLAGNQHLTARFQWLLGRTYCGLGEFRRAETLLSPAVTYYGAALGPTHPTTLDAQRTYGEALLGLRHVQDAEACFRAILLMLEGASERDAERIAESRSLLASALSQVGRSHEAQQLLETACSEAARDLGETHEWTLRLRQAHAPYFNSSGDRRGRDELQSVVDALTDTRGHDHPRTLLALSELASMRMSVWEFDEARADLERLLEYQLTKNGPEHPGTLHTQMQLAACSFWQDDYEAAEATCRSVLPIARRTLGVEHPTTIGVMRLLASTLAELGQLEEALTLGEEAVAHSVSVLGDSHVDTLTAKATLGEIYWSLKQYDRAEAMLRHVADERAAELGLAHEESLSTRRSIARMLIEQGRLTEAEGLCAEIQALEEGVYSNDAPGLIVTRNILCQVLTLLRRHSEAEAVAREALEACERVHGPAHDYTIRSAFCLATVLVAQGNYEDAERILRERVERAESVLGKDNPASVGHRHGYESVASMIEQKLAEEWERAVATEGLASENALLTSVRRGRLLVRARRFDEAEELALQSLQRARDSLGPEHAATALIQGLLGFCHLEEGDLVRAEPELLEAYDALCKSLGPEYGASCGTAGLLVQLYERSGRPLDAEKYRELAGPRAPE